MNFKDTNGYVIHNFFYKNIKIYLYTLTNVIKIFMNIKNMNGYVINFFYKYNQLYKYDL